jgi:hypothetical protein
MIRDAMAANAPMHPESFSWVYQHDVGVDDFNCTHIQQGK